MKITTTDIINSVLKHGENHIFSDVSQVFKTSLYRKINNICKQNNNSISGFTHEWEINAKVIAGRTMITLIAPDKDWMSFLGASDKDTGSLHGVYHEDELLSKWVDFANFLNDFSDEALSEIFLADGGISII